MNTETINLVTGYLDTLGTKLGIAVESMFPYFVKQQYIEGITSFFVFIVFFFACCIFIGFCVRHWNPKNKVMYNIRKSESEVLFFILGFILVFLTIIFLSNFIREFPEMFNPEYAAIKDILTLIKQDIAKC